MTPKQKLSYAQQAEFAKALTAAFPTKSALKAVVWASDKSFEAIAGNAGTKSDAMQVVEDAAASNWWRRLLAAALDENPTDHALRAFADAVGFTPVSVLPDELVSLHHFDLQDVSAVYEDLVFDAPDPTRRVIAFGVTFKTPELLASLRERFKVVLAAEATRDADDYLDPTHPARLVNERLRRLKDVLKLMPVLCNIQATNDAEIAEFWNQVLHDFNGPLDHLLVLFIAAHAGTRFPSQVQVLPVAFRKSHVRQWVYKIAKYRRWKPDNLAEAWVQMIFADPLARGSDPLDAAWVYDRVRDAIEALKDESALHAQLSKRSPDAVPPSD